MWELSGYFGLFLAAFGAPTLLPMQSEAVLVGLLLTDRYAVWALLAVATERLSAIPGLRIFGTAPGKAAVISFLVEGAHAHDLATLLDLQGVAVRSGQHCAHPLLQYFGVAATCRASLAFYNTHAEIERFMTALTKVRKLLG